MNWMNFPCEGGNGSSLSRQAAYWALKLCMLHNVVYSSITDIYSLTSEGSVECYAVFKCFNVLSGGNRGLSVRTWLLFRREIL